MTADMFSGVFAPLPTPIDECDGLDCDRLRRAMPRWLESRLAGFVLLGTNGEAGLLSDEEADQLVAVARDLIPRGRPLIAGAARESTKASIEAVKRAAGLGVDAVMVRTPAFFKGQMTPTALINHYVKVADASPAPVLLYNFSAATGVNLLPATAATLARHPNIVGIKESGSDIAQISDLVTLSPEGFSVLAGSASTFLAALATGVSGGVLALASLLPDACVQLFDHWKTGEVSEAQVLQRQLLPLARLISTSHGVAGLKAALSFMGCDVGRPRSPLLPISQEAIATLRETLITWKESRNESIAR